MEVFLLLLDEIDDAVAVLRSVWPRILGLALAVSLLFATGFALILLPHLTFAAAALLPSVTLLVRARRRRLADSAASGS